MARLVPHLAKTLKRFRRRKQSSLRRNRRAGLRCEALQERVVFSANAIDLSILNDEFDDSSTIAEWQLVSQAEGWQSAHFETYDIDQTTSGSMTISPHTSTWYQDYQGDLSFKEVSGDFAVTTHVSVTDLDVITDSDPDDIPNGGTFSLGGVMLRTPTEITDAPNEWTAGNNNFVFLSLGHGYDGTMSFESKTTVDSTSDLELIPADQNTAELRVVREGASITTMYRYDSESDWQIAANFDRPDMPETLQVGLVGYSDYGKTSTFDPFYVNNTTLVDTPENAVASSNPAMPYSPDLQASFDYIRFERVGIPNLVTVDVPVVNSGFEDISTESPYNEFTFGALPGWDLYDPHEIAGNGSGPQFYIGTLQPGEVPGMPGVIQNFPGGAPEGSRVGIAFNFDGSGDLGEYGMEQTLDTLLTANTDYALSVDIGNIATGVALNGTTFFLEGFPGYQVALMAGDEVIALDDNSLAGAIPEGEFATSTIHFSSGADHPLVGQPLGIRLINLNDTSDVPAGNDLEVDFDNVRLLATMVETMPEFETIGDQQVNHFDTLTIDLPETLASGEEVSYNLEVLNDVWVGLDSSLEIAPNEYNAAGEPQYYESYNNFGFRWLRTGDGGWIYLDTDGSLNQWQGSVAASTLIAELDPLVYASPELLHDAISIGDATLDGNTLTLDPTDSASGTYFVAVDKNAGSVSEREIVAVEVINTGLEIPEIEDQVAVAGETAIIELVTVTNDGTEINYEVEIVQNTAADLRDEYDIVADAGLVAGDYGYDYLGRQERWVQSSIGWIFITTEGTVHDWNGSYETSPELARLDSSYHADPGLLVAAEHIAVAVEVIDGELQITPPSDFVGSLSLRLAATDGANEDEREFAVEFQAWSDMVDSVFGE